MLLTIDENGRGIQAVATGLAEVLSIGGETAEAENGSTMYLLSAVTDTYWAVVNDSTAITSSNGNFLKAGGYVYIPVPQSYVLRVDASGSATAGLCF